MSQVNNVAAWPQDLGLRAKFEDAAVGAACAAVQQRLATHAVGEHTRGVLADALHWADAVPLQFLRSALLAQVSFIVSCVNLCITELPLACFHERANLPTTAIALPPALCNCTSSTAGGPRKPAAG